MYMFFLTFVRNAVCSFRNRLISPRGNENNELFVLNRMSLDNVEPFQKSVVKKIITDDLLY